MPCAGWRSGVYMRAGAAIGAVGIALANDLRLLQLAPAAMCGIGPVTSTGLPLRG